MRPFSSDMILDCSIDRFLLQIICRLSKWLENRVDKELHSGLDKDLRQLLSMNESVLSSLTRPLIGLARNMGADREELAAVRNLGREVIASALEPENHYLIPEFKTRSTPPLNTWTYQNQLMEWNIRPGELVLDIGCGGWPFTNATHLADMYSGETTHRVEPLRRDDRPFLTVDVTSLPFRDKTWDFVFCSHVLEHVEEPGKALRELARVGRRGYIEAPTKISDVMLNFTGIKNHHRWHTLLLTDTLVFIEWRDDERHDLGTDYFFRCLHSNYRTEFQAFFENNWGFFFTQYRWEGTVKFLVIDKTGRVIDGTGMDPVAPRGLSSVASEADTAIVPVRKRSTTA